MTPVLLTLSNLFLLKQLNTRHRRLASETKQPRGFRHWAESLSENLLMRNMHQHGCLRTTWSLKLQWLPWVRQNDSRTHPSPDQHKNCSPAFRNVSCRALQVNIMAALSVIFVRFVLQMWSCWSGWSARGTCELPLATSLGKRLSHSPNKCWHDVSIYVDPEYPLSCCSH